MSAGPILVALVALLAGVRSVYRHRRGLAELVAGVLLLRAWIRGRRSR